MNKSELNEKISEGYVHARAILEMAGKPKEHIEETLKQYVEKIKNTEGIEVIDADFAETKEIDEDAFGAFVELELLTKGAENLVWFCFDFMPSSIEIIDPETLKYDSHEFTNLLNDLQTRLHNTDMIVKKVNATNMKLNANIEALLKNAIAQALRAGKTTLEEVSAAVGIKSEELANIMEQLVQMNKIVKEGDKFKLANK